MIWLGLLIFIIGATATYWAYRQYDFRYDKVFFCDGVDDQVQIQKAIDYAHRVCLGAGVFNIEALIELKNHCELVGVESHGRTHCGVLVRSLRQTASVRSDLNSFANSEQEEKE